MGQEKGAEDVTEKRNLGKRHTCSGCGGKFYDLNKVPATCPKCGMSTTTERKSTQSTVNPALDDRTDTLFPTAPANHGGAQVLSGSNTSQASREENLEEEFDIDDTVLDADEDLLSNDADVDVDDLVGAGISGEDEDS